MKKNTTPISARSRLYTSVLLVLLALVAVTAATVAWFSIADNTKVKSMSLDIVSGTDLRMDLDPHETLEEYVKTLSFDQIAERIQQEKGFSMQETPLEPVTTQDEETFTFENGTVAESTSGVYLEFTHADLVYGRWKNLDLRSGHGQCQRDRRKCYNIWSSRKRCDGVQR